MASNSVLAKMAVIINAQTAEFNKALKGTEQSLKSFTRNIESMATSLGLAFGVKEVAQFAFEVSKLAGEAEGVGTAFKRLPESTILMEQLKLATGNTVSELELMKRAVQASNFEISLQALPKLLEFATLRAQQTGQSVDYLVESIILGIGRKSPLILDNLGISAIRLREKLNGVSAEAASVGDVAKVVGDIANEELKKMAGFSENAATEVQRLDAAWENFKVTLGKTLNSSGLFANSLAFLTDLLNDFSGENKLYNAVFNLGVAFNAGDKDATGFLETVKELEKEFGKGNLAITAKDLESITANMKHAATVSAQLKERLAELGIQIVGLNEIPLGPDQAKNTLFKFFKDVPIQITNLEALRVKLQELNTQFDETDINDKKRLENIGQEILAVQAQIDKLEELRKKREQLGTPTTAFGKEQLANAEQGKQTTFFDPSQTTSRFTLASDDTTMLGNAMFPDITEQVDSYIQNIQRAGETYEQWAERMTILGEQQDAQFQKSIDTALAWGDAIGQSIAASIQGSENAAQSLKRLTSTIVQQFFRQALGAIIASATKSGGPPPVAIALAAAGVAAVSAMFSRIGATTGGGGASIGSSATRNYNSRATTSTTAQDSAPEVIGVLRGQDLWLMAKNVERNDKKTRGG